MKTRTTSGRFPSCLQKFLFLTYIMIAVPVFLLGGDLKYPVSAIPPELLKNADLVVRLDETVLEISSLTKVTERVHLVYTVLRESAREKAALRIYYDNDSKISRLEGKIYDTSGKQTDRIRTSEITDQSAVPSGTLYSDDRVKYIRPVLSHYPYTVEYEFERSFRQLMQYPQWKAIDDYNIAVEYASLVILAPKEVTPRYLSVNFPQSGSFPVKNGDSSLSWELHNIPAMIPEPLSAGIGQIVPSVYIAPAMVMIPGQNPEPATWKSYGMWINWLNHDRDILPKEVIMKIRQIISDSDDQLTVLKAIYHYFQDNTRYISVQIGIGGYQPADAASVANDGYGDCKALTNYLKALLGCAGINSYYTLVKAGEWDMPIRTDFPSLQFNHAILCVPLGNDTIWLECTSHFIPFGYLGMFTDNREVLLITPDGGVLVRTPSLQKTSNRLLRTAVFDLDTAGNANIACTTKVSGLQYELFKNRLHQSNEEQKEMLREEIAIPTMNIAKLHYIDDPNEVPEATEILEMIIPAYATLTGNRIFLPLNTLNRVPPLPILKESRKLPFYSGIGFSDTDSIIFRFPSTFTADYFPEAIMLNTRFGEYTAEVTWNNNELLYVRRYIHLDGEFSPEDYFDYHAFNKLVAKADRNKAVLKK